MDLRRDGVGRSSFCGRSGGISRQLFDGRVVFLVGLPSCVLVLPAGLLGREVPEDNGVGPTLKSHAVAGPSRR